MPNTLNNAALVTAVRGALAALYHSVQTLPTVALDYGQALERGKGDTARVRVEGLVSASNFAGTANAQDLTEVFVDVKVDQQPNSQVSLSAKELTFGIEDLSLQVIKPQLRGIAAYIDTYLNARIVAAAPSAAVGATKTSFIDVLSLGRKALNDNKVPMDGDRFLVLTAADAQRVLKIAGLLDASAVSDGGLAWREGFLGRKMGVNIYESQYATTSTLYHRSAVAAAFGSPAAPIGGALSGADQFEGIVAQLIAGFDNASIGNRLTAHALFGAKENLDGGGAGTGKRAVKLDLATIVSV
jgi:hypothetical protein